MTDDFTPTSAGGRPTWTAVATGASTFTPVTVTQLENVEEAGYDEGGFGEGGFDSPSITYPPAAQPTWTEVTDR